ESILRKAPEDLIPSPRRAIEESIRSNDQPVVAFAQREECGHEVSRARIPQPRATIAAAGRKQLPVGGESHRADAVRVPLERVQFTPRRNVPELSRLIITARSQRPPVWAKRKTCDPVLVP